MTLVIGSTAVKHWFPDFPREPKDLDMIGPTHDYDKDEVLGDVFWHPMLYGTRFDGRAQSYALLDELYTIKVSHSYWELPNGSWDKHVHDIIWLKRRGATLDPDLHSLLYTVWQEVHGKKKVNLAMSAGQFFADAVPRLYDHDSIHESVAYGDHALYIDFLKPGEEIAIDMPAVKAAPHQTQVKLFREEVAATALERIIIPSDYRRSAGMAWKWALRRTITSLTKGWSARFIVDNIVDFIKPDDYVTRHRNNMHKLINLEEK